MGAFNTMLNEKRRSLTEWVQLMPVVKRALNAAYRKRYKDCPYEADFGGEPGTLFAMLKAHEEDDRTMETLGPARVQAQMDELSPREPLHK